METDPHALIEALDDLDAQAYSYGYAVPRRPGDTEPIAQGPRALLQLWECAEHRLDAAGKRVGLPMSNDPNGSANYWPLWVERTHAR